MIPNPIKHTRPPAGELTAVGVGRRTFGNPMGPKTGDTFDGHCRRA